MFRIRLVLLGTAVSQCRMPSFPVVPAFDVFKNWGSPFFMALPQVDTAGEIRK
jgi:hypothetical protein